MVKILIAGDYAPGGRVAQLIHENKFENIFSEVQPYTLCADYSILNLEAPVVDTDKVTPISKCGPHLKCSAKALNAAKYAGFNMLTLANNHIFDFGALGIKTTVDLCRELDIDYLGAGMNFDAAQKIFYKQIKGINFAFINCCEREFSIATQDSAGANPLDPIKQYYAITEARKLAEYVILIVHGGPEHYQLPSPRMKETYRCFIDMGADAVINHHQHCYSGYEIYNGRPIVYGLGNFCFDKYPSKRDRRWYEGYMVELLFDSSITLNIHPYVQCNAEPTVSFLDGEHRKLFLKNLYELNLIIGDDIQLNASYNKWINASDFVFKTALTPWNDRITKSLYRRNLLPSFITEEKRLFLLNILECQSHLDKLIQIVKKMKIK